MLLNRLSSAFAYLVLFYLLVLTACTGHSWSISALRCEYLRSPIHIDVSSPRFTWGYEGSAGGMQTAYQLELADAKEALLQEKPLWTSGRVESGQSKAVYSGAEQLRPHARYYWRVTAWDNRGQRVVSAIDSFETAKMQETDWTAQWITDQHDASFGPAPMFRKVFSIHKEIAAARLYVSAAAYYKLYLNGKEAGTAQLDPGYTHYDKRNLYTTLDVTSALRMGENVVATVLGNGFYNAAAPVATWDFDKARWRDRARMVMEIHIQHTDGTITVIPTDDTWKTATGPHVYNNIYSGETYDARKQWQGWNDLRFDDVAWQPAVPTRAPSPRLVSQTMPPMRITDELPAVAMQAFGDTVFVFDMGINLTGVCRINVRGEEGTKVTLTHGELLKDNGRIEMRNLDIYYKPIKDIEFQTDTYFMSGEGEETFTPAFTYHGFRYVEVRSDRPIKLDKADVTALFIHTDLERVGQFSCSNELLNKIWSATNQSYVSNLHSIPTDCPQREKNGWTADGHIAIDLALLNFDGIKFYEKWLDDFIDNQRPEGNISGIIPSAGWGYDDWIGPVWDAALFIIPDALERYYGDTRAIHKVYDACEKYLEYLRNRENEEGTVTYGIGDWVYYHTQTPTEYTTTCFYYWDQVLMARFSDLTGHDGTPYRKKAEELKALINRKYFDAEQTRYANGSQTAQAVALALEIVPEEYEKKVAENLNRLIVDNNYHLDFGVLGSKYVPRMLSAHGYAETAYRMATQETAPSWGNWIKLGFTTLAETWVLSPEFRDASVNHVFLGDISAWMVNTLAGINYDPNNRGFEHILIKPDFIADLSWAKGEYRSVKGLIKSEWRREGKQIRLSVTIPDNATATVYTDKAQTVGSGRHEFVFTSH
ncbi:family 78 glycoside hydrolase catalytic domain [Parapedobacter defluvii]|uniref:family 78 glycoside hydrolase catalytic domain n=1 Tax=Parapedobacter defluvii TaxID=2045106 RepID=UPI000FA0FFB0|nr:MAG: glycoside hydrolase [Parapedobacter sp.]